MGRYSARPRLHLCATPLEKACAILAILLLLVSWWLFITRIGKLPEQIPTHFDFSGNVTSLGSKWTLLLGPILGTLLVPMFLLLAKVPHLHNYPAKVTEENAPRLYALSRQTLFYLAPLLAGVFCEMTRSLSETPGSGTKGIGVTFPVLMGLIFAGVIVQAVRMFRAGRGPRGAMAADGGGSVPALGSPEEEECEAEGQHEHEPFPRRGRRAGSEHGEPADGPGHE